MHCILLCITTDNYNLFCSNISTFQLAETKDSIPGCQAIFSDYLCKLRTLKRGFTAIKTSCWRLNYADKTWARIWAWLICVSCHKKLVMGRGEWQGCIVPFVAVCSLVFNLCQEATASPEDSSLLKNRDQSNIIAS